MKHQITTKITGEEWEQIMVCEFANATIAALVMEDIESYNYEGRLYIRHPDGRAAAARVEHKEATITVTCNSGYSWRRYWHDDPNANLAELENLARSWQVKEGIYLPAMRYFEAGAKAYNESFRKWSDQHDEDFCNLEYHVKELERKLDANQNRQESTDIWLTKELRGYGEALDELDEALSLHKESRFHFLKRKETQ